MASKTKQKKLHKFIATGGKPKNFKGALSNAVANKKK
jgi:hypothetical protein